MEFHEDQEFPQIMTCRSLHSLNESLICAFVNDTTDCKPVSGFFDYTYFTYCTLSILPLAVIILCGWLGFLFVALAVTADDFFCPSLVVISSTLRLSDNLAGITLLAFGNGAPDVFSAIAAIRSSKDGDISLAFGALLGSGVFITTVVAGSVCIAQPFRMMERPFLRDVIFYIASVFLTFCILRDGKISTAESIAYILTYVVYVVIVFVARLIYQRIKAEANTQDRRLSGVVGNSVSSIEEYRSVDDTLDQPIYTAHHSHSPNYLGSDGRQIQASECDTYRGIDETTPLVGEDNLTFVTVSPMTQFLHAISPIDIEQWKESHWISKVIAVIKGVAKFIMRLTVPVVDYTAPRNNWNRHLNTLHCISSPLMAVYLVKPELFLHYIGGVFPVWAVVLLAGLILSLIVFFTTKMTHPPCYHWIFAYSGFIVAVLWIQCIATEVVNLLQTFGVVFNLSYAILGLTFLAWGNSIGDLIADVTMARQGYPRTGISACYGGPMFNLLLGVGIPFTIVCAKHGGSIKVELSVVEVLLIGSLLVILVGTLVTVPFILKFQMTRSFGAILYALYFIFLILAVLVEMGIIKWNAST